MLLGSGNASGTVLAIKQYCDLQRQPKRVIITRLQAEKGISFCKQSLPDYGERQHPSHDLCDVYGTSLLACILDTHVLDVAICSQLQIHPWKHSGDHKLNLASVVAFPLHAGLVEFPRNAKVRAISREVLWFAGIFNSLGNPGIRLRINIYLHNCVDLR